MGAHSDHRVPFVLVAVLLLGLVGCASSGDASAPDPSTSTSTTTRPVATAGEPDGTTVLLAGDSIMRELAPALTAAIEGGGRDQAEFVLAPTLPHTAGDVVVWRAFLDRVQPDVVVLHVGIWERLKVLGDFATGARTEPGAYRDEVVEPALDLVADAGARLLWVSPVPVREADKAAFVRSLARQWSTAIRARDDATLLDVTPTIAPHGFSEVLAGEQVRRSDGIHLCPAGQRLVAEAVVRSVRPLLAEPPPSGWATNWLRSVHEAGGCADGRG